MCGSDEEGASAQQPQAGLEESATLEFTQESDSRL
jgi:hypothetical protein